MSEDEPTKREVEDIPEPVSRENLLDALAQSLMDMREEGHKLEELEATVGMSMNTPKEELSEEFDRVQAITIALLEEWQRAQKREDKGRKKWLAG